MPQSPCGEIPPEEPAQMLAVLRCAQYGDQLARHLLWWCADGRSPTEIAAVLCCSRSSGSRAVHADRKGLLGLAHDDAGRLVPISAP